MLKLVGPFLAAFFVKSWRGGSLTAGLFSPEVVGGKESQEADKGVWPVLQCRYRMSFVVH